MSFQWPIALWLLLALPACVAGYAWLLRRRQAAVRWGNVALLRAAMGQGPNWRRHVPPALLLLALAAMVLAIARPTATVTLPAQRQTIVLAIDVSLSMRAADVKPDRITAAQSAARAFVEAHPSAARIAIVAFGGSAQLVQRPTGRNDELIEAIDRLQLQYATATGSAIAVALATLFPEDAPAFEAAVFGHPGGSGASRRTTALERSGVVDRGAVTRPAVRAPVRPGSYPSGVIVLLSDGRRTTGPDPVEVARMAADRGVRVFTVGFGTVEGATIGFDGWQAFVQLDEETLRAVADITRGTYYHADTADGLKRVYRELNSRFVMERQDTEAGALFSALAVLLAATAGVLSLAWFGRSPSG
jgi:Ca-activated chloride channel family protein